MATGTLTRAIMRLMTNQANLVTKQFIDLAAKGFQSAVTEPAFVGKTYRMFIMVKYDRTGGVFVSFGKIEVTYNIGKRKRE
jgi:hypothetical protein